MKQKKKKKKDGEIQSIHLQHLQVGENLPLNFYLKQKVLISPLGIKVF